IRREASAEDSIRPAGPAENSFFFLPTSLTPRVDCQPPIAAVAQQHKGVRQEADTISLEQRELWPRRVHQLGPDAATRQRGKLERQIRRRIAENQEQRVVV